MKFKIIHPLWVHLPALLCTAASIFFTIRVLPLPDSVPLHFDLQGVPNRYGPAWQGVLLLPAMAVFYLFISVWLDELWARQEKKKNFNWMSLLDEFVAGALCGVQFAYMNMLASHKYIFPFPWLETALACLVAVGSAIILEWMRPFRAYRAVLKRENAEEVRAEVSRLMESGQPMVYWEAQNPAYVGGLSIIIPLLIFVAAFFTWAELPWLTVLLILIGASIFTMYGGFRTVVTRETLTVKMGIFGFRLLQLKTKDIVEASVYGFEPLRDFGGYGIRFNGTMQAYYLQGDAGVKIVTRNGKSYLIGSNLPAHLAAVINAVAGL